MSDYRPATALREHMLAGHRVTLLEAILLFGVQGPNAELGRLKRDGFLIGSRRISLTEAIRRVNTFTRCDLPPNLPRRGIQLTEYWVKK